MPRAIVSVTNDLTTDQRVDRTCQALLKAGFEVLLVGRRLRNSKVLSDRSYRMHRFRLLFDKGALFYAEYNIVLFFYLMTHPFNLVVSNDLDTLPANFMAFRLKRLFGRTGKRSGNFRHLHDCHEYFRGVPELNGRKLVSAVWKWIEDRIFPQLQYVVAVNQSVADLYHREYGNQILAVRNVPTRKSLSVSSDRTKLPLSLDSRIILYQGAVNVDRGLEEAIAAMKYLKTNAILVIAGIGDEFEALKKLVITENLSEKVIFLGQVPFQELHAITLTADLGISIEKDVSVNYHYCLPNKFLDYIQANVPVLVSPFPEMKAIVEQYHIGEFIDSHHPEKLAAHFDRMLSDEEKCKTYKANLLIAAEELCWDKEERKLLKLLNT